MAPTSASVRQSPPVVQVNSDADEDDARVESPVNASPHASDGSSVAESDQSGDDDDMVEGLPMDADASVSQPYSPAPAGIRFVSATLPDDIPLAAAYPPSRRPDLRIFSKSPHIVKRVKSIAHPDLRKNKVKPTYRLAQKALTEFHNPDNADHVTASEGDSSSDNSAGQASKRASSAKKRSNKSLKTVTIDGKLFVEVTTYTRRKGRPPRGGWKDGENMIVETELIEKEVYDLENSEHSEDENQVRVVRSTHSENELARLDALSDYTEDPWDSDRVCSEGEAKIIPDGDILGDREYKARVFKITPPRRQNHPDRLYAFSIDIARIFAHRDSGAFYNINDDIPKLFTTQRQRNDLLKRGLLLPRNVHRSSTVIPIRACFRRFGRRMIRKGRRGLDDYSEGQARTGKSEDEEEEALLALEAARSKESNKKASTREAEMLVKRRRFGETKLSDEIIDARDMQAGFGKPTASSMELPQAYLLNLASSVRSYNRRITQARRSASGFADWNLGIRQVPDGEPDAPVVVLSTAPNGHGGVSASSENRGGSLVPIACLPGQRQAGITSHKRRFNILFDAPTLLPKPVPYPAPAAPPGAPPEQLRAYASASTVRGIHDGAALAGEVWQSHGAGGRSLRQARATGLRDINGSELDIDEVESQHLQQAPDNRIYCGFQTKSSGRPCMRPVNYVGEKCLYHVKEWQAQQEAMGVSQTKEKTPRSRSRKKGDDVRSESGSEFDDHVKTSAGRSKYIHNKKKIDTDVAMDAADCMHCQQEWAPPLVDTNIVDVEARTTPITRADTIKCTLCRRPAHLACFNLTTAQLATATRGYQWRCNDCKVCAVCHQTGDESTLLICDGCDRAWHSGCVEPSVDELPDGKWLCGLCKRCHSCEVRAMGAAYRDAVFSNRRIRRGRPSGSSGEVDEMDDADVQPAPKSRGGYSADEYAHPTAVSNEIVPSELLPVGSGMDDGESKRSLHICTFCPPCASDFTAGRYCPCCLETYKDRTVKPEKGDEDDVEAEEVTKQDARVLDGPQPHQRRRRWWHHPDNMVCCDACDRWTHPGCDAEMTQRGYEALVGDANQEYVCPVCRMDEEERSGKAGGEEWWKGHKVRAGVRVRELAWVQSVGEGASKLRVACVGQRGDGAEWFTATGSRAG